MVKKYIKSIYRRLKTSIYTRKIKRTVKSYGEKLQVNGKSYATDKTVLGNNVNFNGMRIKGIGSVTIGSNFHSGTECLMISHIHNYDYGKAIPYDETSIAKDIVIDDNVWFGDRVIVLGGVHIGEGAIIQAGSCVVNDIPSCAIAGGHPAKVFKYRDVDHYNEMKNKGLFF